MCKKFNRKWLERQMKKEQPKPLTLDQLEKYRSIRATIVIIIVCIMLLALIIDFSNGGLIVCIILCFPIISIISDYKYKYKKNVLPECFKEIFEDVTYNPVFGIPEKVVEKTKMMKMGDVYSSSDYLSGNYKKVTFACSDVHIQYEYKDRDDQRRYITIFKGQWFVFEFNKNFKSNLQLIEKSLFGFGAKRRYKSKKIEVEDEEFNDTFKIYAGDEHEAFYILTPHFIEKIKEVNNKLSGKMLLCFVNNELHIGLNNSKDLFEPSLFQKIDIETIKENTLKDVRIITEFVDTLDLDNDLFKRR